MGGGEQGKRPQKLALFCQGRIIFKKMTKLFFFFKKDPGEFNTGKERQIAPKQPRWVTSPPAFLQKGGGLTPAPWLGRPASLG